MTDHLKTYLQLGTEYYDYRKKITQEEFTFYHAYALKAAGNVLEPMCGTGRLLIPLLRAGIPIEGFDASPHMLDALQKKHAIVSNQPAPVWQAFVENFSCPQQYQLIFIPFGSFGLILDPAVAQQSLQNLHRHLAPEGILILEIDTIYSAPTTTDVWETDKIIRPDGSQLILNTLQSYDQLTQRYRCQCRYTSEHNGTIERVEEEDFQQYLYQPDEMDQLLTATGFSIVGVYQDYHHTSATSTAPLRLYVVTKK